MHSRILRSVVPQAKLAALDTGAVRRAVALGSRGYGFAEPRNDTDKPPFVIYDRPAFGMPITADMSTSYMERWNLTIRMQNRRFTRLTNGFSMKLENHEHMLALSMVYYNFCRKHQSLKGQTPAMAAHLTKYRWTASDLLSLDMWFSEEAVA